MSTEKSLIREAKQTRLTFDRLASILSVAAALFAGIALIVMLVLVLLDVAGRTLFLSPVRGTLEIVSYILLPIIVFGGYAIAHQRDQHMRMTLVYGALRGRAGIWNRLVVELLTLIGIAVLVFYAWERMQRAISMQEAEVGLVTIPIWPTTIFMTLGLALFFLQSLAILIRDTRRNLVKPRTEGTK